MINRDYYLAPWWIRKSIRGRQWKIKLITHISIWIMLGFAALLAWLFIGCSGIRSCNSYQAGVDTGAYWDACFSQSQAQDDEEYGQIINSMMWERN